MPGTVLLGRDSKMKTTLEKTKVSISNESAAGAELLERQGGSYGNTGTPGTQGTALAKL